jgi:glycosyltransferase involved in cell wall biosynthesis
LKNPGKQSRILLVTPHTIPDYSGSGINAFYFARFLKKKKHKVTILTFNRNLKMAGREIKDGVPILRVPYFNMNILTKLLSLIIILPAYLIQILKTRIIFIYGAHIIGYEAIIFMGRMFRKILIFRSLMIGSDDAATLFRGKNKVQQKFYCIMFRQLDLYFSINPVFAERFRTYIGNDVKVLTHPQGVDTEIFQPGDEVDKKVLREKYGIDPDGFIILSVGFLINRKGFKEVFKVLGEISYDFRYILVGEHEFPKGHFLHGKNEEARIIREEGAYYLNEKLILTGSIDMVTDYYHMADMVLINSKREGLPNTLLEAMACGKAILVRDLPGVSFFVQHHINGIIYQDHIQMKDWIDKLHSKPELRSKLGNMAHSYIKGNATFEMTWKQINTALKNSRG